MNGAWKFSDGTGHQTAIILFYSNTSILKQQVSNFSKI